MTLWMWILIIFIIGQRLIELKIARHNEQWMKSRGGIEKGAEHYKWFIILHTAFFMSILFEVLIIGESQPKQLNVYLLTIFLLTQVGRVWCIYTLGKFWNTKIIVIPGVSLIRKGPYKYMKHPNYVIVGVELFIIPMLFGAYMTAIIFPILHIILLRVRIPREDKALAKASLPNVLK